MSLTVKVSNKISDFSQNDIDELSSSLFTTHRFLELIENFEGINIDPCYIAVFSDYKLEGLAVFYFQTDSIFDNFEKSVFGFLTSFLRVFPGRLSPSLICYCPLGISACLLELSADQSETVLELLVKTAETEAVKRKVKTLVFSDASFKKNIDKKLTGLGFLKLFSNFESLIEIDPSWKNFNDFALSQNKTNLFSRERNSVDKLGIERRITNNISEVDEIINLINKTFIKYRKEKSKFDVDIFKMMIDNLKEDIFFITYQKKEKLIAFSVGFYSNKEIFGFKVGHLEDNGFVFFDSTVYTPIEIAIKNNFKTLNLGTSSYNYKILRGAKLKPLYNYVKPIGTLKSVVLRYPLLILNKLKKLRQVNSLREFIKKDKNIFLKD
jgi:predicted N-acyltransferase